MTSIRPSSFVNLSNLTHFRFSKAQMKRLYRIFKSECPSGLITEEVFHNIFSKFFPLDAENYNGENLLLNCRCIQKQNNSLLFSNKNQLVVTCDIYMSLHIAANVSSYSHYVFSAIAQEDAEVITFEVFYNSFKTYFRIKRAI